MEPYSPAYQRAWQKLGAANWNPARLTADEVRALEEDAHTKTWMAQLRGGGPATPHPFTQNCTCATCAHTTANSKALAHALARAVKSAAAGDASGLSQLFQAQKKNPAALAQMVASCLAVVLARPAPKYCGVWSGVERYLPLNFVTDRGSLWVAKQPNVSTRPGSGDAAAPFWQLCTKSGDAR